MNVPPQAMAQALRGMGQQQQMPVQTPSGNTAPVQDMPSGMPGGMPGMPGVMPPGAPQPQQPGMPPAGNPAPGAGMQPTPPMQQTGLSPQGLQPQPNPSEVLRMQIQQAMDQGRLQG